LAAPYRGFDQGAGYVFRHIARPSLCRVDGDHMQRVIVPPTHHVADDGVSIDLSGDRFHIGGSERAEVAEDEMQIKIEGGNKGGKHQALLPNTTVEKRLGDLMLAAKFETAGGVTTLTTSDARSHAPRYQSASKRCFGDNLQRIGLRELAAL
jgi:hypothetical protein